MYKPPTSSEIEYALNNWKYSIHLSSIEGNSKLALRHYNLNMGRDKTTNLTLPVFKFKVLQTGTNLTVLEINTCENHVYENRTIEELERIVALKQLCVFAERHDNVSLLSVLTTESAFIEAFFECGFTEFFCKNNTCCSRKQLK